MTSETECPFLQVSKQKIDLIICEVKSSHPKFNDSIRTEDNLKDVLAWTGVIKKKHVNQVAKELLPLLGPHAGKEKAALGVVKGSVRVRAMLSCPNLDAASVNRWCLTGDVLLNYLYRCFDTAHAPVSCSRRYGLDNWGPEFESIVRYFKSLKMEKQPVLSEIIKQVADA